ncbi:MAG: S8 family peptidase [Acidobacteria bacterium]|nr:S8 family peptidase [Acidobacteriota bacterium]
MTKNSRSNTKKSERMKRRRSPCHYGRALTVAMMAVTALFFGAATVRAQQDHSNGRGPKLSPDLVEILKKGSHDGSIRLVAVVESEDTARVVAKIHRLGGRVNKALRHVDQIILDLPKDRVEEFASAPGVRYVIPDRPVQGFASHLQETTGSSNVYPGAQTDFDLMMSEYGLGYDGAGITVAVLDSGIYKKHFDLNEIGSRVVHAVDFVDGGTSNDLFGHGSHVAGIIAGSGSAFNQEGLDFGGIAPAASLVDLRVLDDQGRGSISNVIAAVDYAIAQRDLLNIRILNLSLAAPPVESYRHDPLCQAVERAVKAGIVVIVAAGNFGIDESGNKVYGSIPSPGISPAVITVGATDTRHTDFRSDDTIAPFSSRGPTRSGSPDPETGEYVYDNLPKPDLVAPGLGLVSLESPDNTLVTSYPALHYDTGRINKKSMYMTLSGTSMAAGVVSGATALILQANPSLTPNHVRAVLMYCAEIIDGPDLFEQGAGLLNVDCGVRLARKMSWQADTLLAGDELMSEPPSDPTSSIAGESIAWSQGLIWTYRWIYGASLITTQQEAYAQGLIWSYSYYGSWGGTSIYSNTYSDDHVVYGSNGTWQGVTWDSGTADEEGVEYYDALATGGALWQNDLISDDFYTVDASGLIWTWRFSYTQGLIWSYGGAMPIWFSGLIWTLYF